MPIRPLSLAGALALTAAAPGASQAAPAYETYFGGTADRCYARSYDAAHLAAHPKQRVATIGVSSEKSYKGSDQQPPREFVLGLAFRMKARGEAFANAAICTPAGEGISCYLEGDGGRFALSPSGPALKLTLERVEIEGAKSFSPDLAKGGDDRVFLLQRAPMAVCNKIAR